MKIDYSARAQALVGTRFRPQGRAGDGIDCVGLALLSFDIPVSEIRRDYQLRGEHRKDAGEALVKYFRRVPPSQSRSGDLMLLAPAKDQLHLAILTRTGFVHAHAGLRRVVETPGDPEWPLLGLYRKRKGR